ncbi:MAG: methylaspartate mutase accessory protein GlmL [Erysipelotrichaceae bacterium]
MPVYLLFDVGSTYTKGCVVDTDKEEILATASVFTTAETDISFGIESAKKQMKKALDEVSIAKTLVCSSAKGGLKMVAIGLVPDLTLKAATLACFSAGAKVIRSYAFELNDTEIRQIEDSGCDILLLCGGTDGGNFEVVLHNAKKIAGIMRKFPIIYAGNKSCQDEIKQILTEGGFECSLCQNVMPSYGILEVDECRQQIRTLFLNHIVKAKGLSKLTSTIEEIVLPTPYSVLEALTLLSKGTKHEAGMGDLMAIDIGGATTDVYSINAKFEIESNVGYKGLHEPLEKRSVEGDLGVRFNAQSVYELKRDSFDEDPELTVYIDAFDTDITHEPNESYDTLLAKWCAEIACRRHAGRLETAYTPMGVSYYQQGKDLRETSILIGIGGPILHAQHPESILSQALSSAEVSEILLPRRLDYYLDRAYIISCLGLLASRHPDQILRMMKKSLENINHDQ